MTASLFAWLTPLALALCLAGAARAEPGAAEDCPLLEATEVSYLVPAATDSLTARFRRFPWPSCTFTWPAARSDTVSIGGRELKVAGEGRLTITVAESHDEDADWRRVLISYGEGPLEEVPAVGDRAVWSTGRHQLSIQSRGKLFHVAIENPDERSGERETAVRFGLLLVDQQE